MNKKATVIFLALLLTITMASARETVLSKADELRIDLLRYDPSPVEPGKPSDIWFEITNMGDEDWYDFKISLVVENSILLKADTKTLNFGRLGAGEKINFRFTITPNEAIPDGDYTMGLQYQSKIAESTMSEPFTMKVKRANRYITATSTKLTTAELDTGMLVQGKPSELTLSIYNPADHMMRDIRVYLDLSSDNIPIAPIGMTAEQKISSIPPKQSTDVKFTLIAEPDAEAGIYKIPMEIKYYDEIGNNYTKDDLIGLIVDGESELHAELKDNDLYDKRGTGEITINFVNKGLSKVKFLTVELAPATEKTAYLWKEYPEYTILSEDKIYLGDIDPDDDESADFTLKIRTRDRKITLPLTLEYRDANNELHTETHELDIDIHSKTTLGLEKKSYAWKIAAGIILIIFFFKYTKWKKQSKKKGLLEYSRHLRSKLSREK